MTFLREILSRRTFAFKVNHSLRSLSSGLFSYVRKTLLLYTLKPKKERFRSATANRASVPCRFSRTRKPCCFVVCVPISVIKVNSSGQHGMIYLHKPNSCGMQYKFSVFFIDLTCPTVCVLSLHHCCFY